MCTLGVTESKSSILAPSFSVGVKVLGFFLDFWLSGKESASSAGDAGDMGSIPGS